MSNSRPVRRKLNRSTSVLIARFAAEVQEQGPGGYFANVQHDDDCPGLKRQFMLWFNCKPEITFNKVASG
jgi:hypothetical protein